MAKSQEANSLTQILADLVAFKTVSGDKLSATECLDYVKHFLRQRGMLANGYEFNGFPAMVATTQPTKTPKVLLHAHLDVVPCAGELFVLKEKNGRLFGRGVYDMKFAAATFLKLVDDLKANLKDYDFGIMFSFDEEIGGENGVKALLNAGYGAKVCVLPDAGDDWHIEVAHKGAWIARLSAKGVAAHGSRPWDGDNAIHRLLDVLQEISQLFKDQHVDSDTLSINTITGGRAPNQVADAAEAILDIRFLSTDVFEQLQQKIETIAANYKITVDTIALVKCVQTDMNNPYVAAFLQVAEDVWGEPLKPIRSLGASEAVFFDEFDIPTILVRPHGGAAHADSEWLDKASFEKYYELIKKYVQKEAKL